MSESLIQQIDSGLSRYYKQHGREYNINVDGKGLFSIFCDANGFDDDGVVGELGVKNINDCIVLDFDEAFPYPENTKPKNKNKAIFNIIKKCSENTNAYKIKNKYEFKVRKQDFCIDNLELKLNEFHEMLTKSSTCEKICKNARPTGGLMQLLYISQNNICQPYIHLLADLFARDCIAYYLQMNAFNQETNNENDIVVNPLTLQIWFEINKHIGIKEWSAMCQEFKLVKSALIEYYNKICPLMNTQPIVKIQDNYREVCKYISAAVDFVYGLVSNKKNSVACPFQYDLCLAFKDVQYYTTDDNKEMKHENSDCFGNIKDRLRAANLLYFAREIDVNKRLRFSQQFDDFKTYLQQKDVNDNNNKYIYLDELYKYLYRKNISENDISKFNKYIINSEEFDTDSILMDINNGYDNIYKQFKNSKLIDKMYEFTEEKEANEYPRRFRIVSVLDRRDSKKDELIFCEAREDCLKLPPERYKCDNLWYFNSSKTCIIPQDVNYDEKSDTNTRHKRSFTEPLISGFDMQEARLTGTRSYANIQDQFKKQLPTDVINTDHAMNNRMMVFSFHVLSIEEIRCYLYFGATMMRFLPQDLKLWLPQFFATSDIYVDDLVTNIEKKLVDLRFEAFYESNKLENEIIKRTIKKLEFSIIDKIDQGLAAYYKQKKTNYYVTSPDVQGKFKAYCDDNGFSDDFVAKELKKADHEENELADFDTEFPFDKTIEDDNEKAHEISRILKNIAKYGCVDSLNKTI